MEKTIIKLFKKISSESPQCVFQMYRNGNDFESISYQQAYESVKNFAGGLRSLGVVRGDHIGIISDNRWEWQHADLGIMAVGALDVPRGCDATPGDLSYILSFAGCKIVIAENSNQLQKILALKNDFPELKTMILFSELSEEDVKLAQDNKVEIYSFNDVRVLGEKYNSLNEGRVEAEIEKGDWDDVVSLIFTSGTTGQPKGVMLSNGNFLTQLDELRERIYMNVGDKGIVVLPIWHVFERICEYVILVQTSTIVYSRPVGSILLSDIKKTNPQILPAVPRVFESIYDGINRKMRKTGGLAYFLYKNFVRIAIYWSRIDRSLFDRTARFKMDLRLIKWPGYVLGWLLLWPFKLLGSAIVFRKIRAMLGNNFRAGVSGGGAFPPAIDEFFWAIGVKVVEGYGLTETAPVVAVRPIKRPIFGTVGSPLRGVSVRVVSMKNGEDVGKCKLGVLQVKGGTVMKGYYKRPDLTAAAIDENEWFNTGDIAILTRHNEIVLRGRAKDTIVQRGGENVEPLPIEMKIQESRYVQTAVLVGQDQRYLAALIVPEQSELEGFAKENNIEYKNYKDLFSNSQVIQLFDTEIADRINAKNGFKMFERVNKFCLLEKPFEVGVELSAKQEVMRYKISEIYSKEIKALFKD